MENRAFFLMYLCLVSVTLSFGSHLSLFCYALKFKLTAGIHVRPWAVLSLERPWQREIKAQRETFPLLVGWTIGNGQQPPEIWFFLYVPFSRRLWGSVCGQHSLWKGGNWEGEHWGRSDWTGVEALLSTQCKLWGKLYTQPLLPCEALWELRILLHR